MCDWAETVTKYWLSQTDRLDFLKILCVVSDEDRCLIEELQVEWMLNLKLGINIICYDFYFYGFEEFYFCPEFLITYSKKLSRIVSNIYNIFFWDFYLSMIIQMDI